MTSLGTHQHLLKLILSCRKITAQVQPPNSATIVAMASSSEPEFLPHHFSVLTRVPRSRSSPIWDSSIASRVGEKLGLRLLEVGITAVRVDLDVVEAAERMDRLRRSALVRLFRSVERAGVRVVGVEGMKEAED
ncbi:hypothetical protein QJS10_CPB18g00396 [Acorus calamus]|uniref:Uncharacterized protein n=1 Tax=Acorus calamus TaxID=4465 RepID=A0AAV9CNZ1_ACOCL|nr:hypothetical protein QJS10_CPB18g00396 [Acorus calamus]